VEAANDLATDQLRAVIERGRQTGLKVFPSLKLQDSAKLQSERCGLLKQAHGAEVCIGDEGRAEWCYDFAHEAVHEDKLAMVGEVLDDYGADGLELDFCFDRFYFKSADVKKNTIDERLYGQGSALGERYWPAARARDPADGAGAFKGGG